MTAKHNCETCPVLADARAENRELRRRIRLARRHGLTKTQLGEAYEAMRYYVRRGVLGEHYATHKAVEALFRTLALLDLRKPLKRGRR